MYEALWDQSPRVQQIRAESEAEGRRKGRTEGRAEGLSLGLTQGVARGEVQALRRVLVHLVKARFPALADLAQEEVERINKPDMLDMLVQQIAIADDEKMARWLLKSVEK